MSRKAAAPLPVKVLDEADADISAAAGWYGERSLKVADAFVEEVFSNLKLIGVFPNMAPRVRGLIRQLPLNGFPFVNLYRPFRDHVVVIRVFHCSQDPKKKFRKKRT